MRSIQHSPGLSFTRLALYLGLTAVLIPVQALAVTIGADLRRSLPLFYHRIVVRLFGFNIILRGKPVPDRTALFASNHISYMDIEILGSLIDGSFIAKNEVKTWPVFGLLAKLQRTVFVDRRPSTAREQRDSISGRLDAGDRLILFPEGTTSDGERLRAFRSALFGAAAATPGGRPVIVQPVTIAYVRLNAIPVGRDMRACFAWYGDMTLAGHLWNLIGLGKTDVVVEFHEPVTIDMFGSRKRLSEHCERVIGRTLAAANSGRLKMDSKTGAITAVPVTAHVPDGNLAIGA